MLTNNHINGAEPRVNGSKAVRPPNNARSGNHPLSKADIREIAKAALAQATTLVEAWLPGGERKLNEYVVRNPTRADDSLGSFKINLVSGKWADFAAGAQGGDLVSLRAYLDDTKQGEAARSIAADLGTRIGSPKSPRHAAVKPARIQTLSRDQAKQAGAATRAAAEPRLEHFRHNRHGEPSAFWTYHAASGDLHHVRARYNSPGGKEVLPWHWNGAAWKCGEPKGSAPMPLYNRADLYERHTAPVLVVEGEKTADAAARLFPGHVVVTSAGGTNAADKTDWTPFAGRSVVIWSDNDGPGSKYAKTVAGLAHQAGAASVAIVTVPAGWPPKWDLADDPPDGVSALQLAAMVEQAVRLEAPGPEGPHGATEEASQESDEAAIDRLARLKELEYERTRSAEAERLGIGRVAMLDKLVSARRKEISKEREAAEEAAQTGEPWPDPVDGGALFSALCERITKHAVLPKHGAGVVAAWCILAHAFDAFRVVPNLAFESAEAGCGKSTTLEVVSHLAPSPIYASNISPAALFRVIDLRKPTLLIDEADTFVKLNEELRGILNCGHAKSTAYIWRCEGEGADLAPRQFSTWCPKALGLIGELPRTLQDRSIVIRLHRKLASEHVAKIKPADLAALLELRRKIARWAQDHSERLSNAEPVMPAGLANRAQDNWAPLVAIADAAGDSWAKAIRAAALAAVHIAAEFDEPSAAVRLLDDMRTIFTEHGAEIGSQAMVNHLVQLDDAPWGSWSHGKPITPRRVAGLLKDFGVKPFKGRTANQWRRADFAEIWTRYLLPRGVQSAAPPFQSSTVPQTQETRAFEQVQSSTRGVPPWNFEQSENPAKSGMRGTVELPQGGEAKNGHAAHLNGDGLPLETSGASDAICGAPTGSLSATERIEVPL